MIEGRGAASVSPSGERPLQSGKNAGPHRSRVRGHATGMAPIQRRNFGLDHQRHLGLRQAKEKIKILREGKSLVEKAKPVEHVAAKKGAVQHHREDLQIAGAGCRVQILRQLFEQQSLADHGGGVGATCKLLRLTRNATGRAYVVRIEEGDILRRSRP